ncbi:MAG: type III-A CRISPR-associated RAMP protein Csm5, partial [Anaerolineales bacterium]|nr:type III-A CRISPR-associated RAMP protein Csm5 [Anaerolineales bacterium]
EKIAGLEPHPIKKENMPACTYCTPQVASVGLTEAQAKDKGYKVKVGRFPFMANGKAIALGEPEGLIKTVFDEPYLPGSTLKGALRTAIAWIAWKDPMIGLVPDVDYLKGEDGKLFHPKQAAQRFEEIIFGKTSKDITKDFMRALQVSDSTPISINSLEIINIHVLKAQGDIEKSIPVESEAIKKGVGFSMTLKVDTALFSEWAKRHGLELSGEKWLDNLPKLLHEHKYTEEYLESEVEWYNENAEQNYLADVHKQYKKKTDAECCFFLQLGAGTGWKNKTLGSRLLANAGYEEEFMETLLTDTTSGGLGVLGKDHKMPQYLDEFPTSRNIKGKSYEPLGWVLVEMEERG